MRSGSLRALALVLPLVAGSATLPSQTRAPVPVAAVDAVLDAFRTHSIVALGDGILHGDETAYQFRLRLVRDPRFAATVNDIVVEFGSARYQDVIDRFTRGEQVPDDVFRHVWQDTTQPQELADRTIYQDFFRAIAALNRTLPERPRLRVLLGDPPIEWEHVATGDDFQRWLKQRDSFPAELIRREVLAKGGVVRWWCTGRCTSNAATSCLTTTCRRRWHRRSSVSSSATHRDPY